MKGACASGWRARFSAAQTRPRVADGFVSEHWAPVSPVTGKLDAFEWRAPVEQLGPLIEQGDDALAIRERPAVAASVRASTIDEDGDAPGEIALDSEDEAYHRCRRAG